MHGMWQSGRMRDETPLETQAPKHEVQSLGGLARKNSLTPERRTEIAKTAAKARWDGAGTPRTTHTGNLTLVDGKEIACAVLEDGTRIITSHGVMKAFGRPWKGTYQAMT